MADSRKGNSYAIKLKKFKKDTIESVVSNFAATKLYEDDFLKDLEEGLKKSSGQTRSTR